MILLSWFSSVSERTEFLLVKYLYLGYFRNDSQLKITWRASLQYLSMVFEKNLTQSIVQKRKETFYTHLRIVTLITKNSIKLKLHEDETLTDRLTRPENPLIRDFHRNC